MRWSYRTPSHNGTKHVENISYNYVADPSDSPSERLGKIAGFSTYTLALMGIAAASALIMAKTPALFQPSPDVGTVMHAIERIGAVASKFELVAIGATIFSGTAPLLAGAADALTRGTTSPLHLGRESVRNVIGRSLE